MNRTERRAADRGQPVLVVDDEADLLELLELTLSRMGLDTDARRIGRRSDRRCSTREPSTSASPTCGCPTATGLRVVEHINQKGLDLPVAVITAYGSAENAVAALKAGAFDYLAKPVALEQLRALVKQALKVPREGAPSRAVGLPAARRIAGDAAGARTDRAAREEPGAGLHQRRIRQRQGARRAHDPRAAARAREQPFVAVNCGAIPENLMESEFFGYRKGAFTGAEADRDGFFQAANGGTLFLDEVADLPLAMQVKLLRAIQEKKVRKVGATQEDPVDVRIISATHKKLAALVEAGEFRQDLYYRLHVIELAMPSLREMREDIPLIANAILARLSRGSGRRGSIAGGASRRCERYRSRQRARAREHPRARPLARRRPQRDHRRGPASHARRRGVATSPMTRRRRSGRCRITSTASSARRSTRRWRRRATTAPRPRSCSASPSAPCATGWSGWASIVNAGDPARGVRAAAGEAARGGIDERGLAANLARQVRSPNRDARPAGDARSRSRRARHHPAAGRVRRRRHRAAVHQPARPRAHPYYDGSARPQGLGALS